MPEIVCLNRFGSKLFSLKNENPPTICQNKSGKKYTYIRMHVWANFKADGWAFVKQNSVFVGF